MAVLKVACPRCGQRVSGDDSFYGTSVECPVCTSKVVFPERPHSDPPPEKKKPEPKPDADADADAPTGDAVAGDEPIPARETNSAPLPPTAEAPGPAGSDEHVGAPLLGVISMVVGIVTVVCLCLPGILLGPVAVICGHMGLASSRRSHLKPAPGENMALTGMILGYVGMAVSFVYLIMLAFPDLAQSFRAGFGGGPDG